MPLYAVRRGQGAGFGADGTPAARLTTMGELVVTDFLQAAVMDGRGYNVRAGTISVPLVGDVVITDTKAEMAVDAAVGSTLMPCAVNISYNLAAGTLFEAAGKSVATVSSAGDAFIPLPLFSGGSDSVSSARVDAEGGVTVTAEVNTTTLQHFSWSQPIAAGAYSTTYDWQPRYAPVLNGARCFYVQIAGTGTGPSYFANADYLEFPTLMVSPS